MAEVYSIAHLSLGAERVLEVPQGVDLAVADGVDRGQEAVGHLAIENWLEQTSRDKRGAF